MTNEIQQTRYDRLLRRVAGIIGPGSKVGEVLTELFPTIDVENVPSELLLLMGTRTAFGGGSITASAGESPKMGLFNPAGSNTIVTLTDVVAITGTNANVIRWGLNTNELGTIISTQQFTDTRNALNQLPVARVATESAVALANATGQTRVTINVPFYLRGKNDLAMLRPGIGFEIGCNATTSLIMVTFYWRERPMETSELLGSG